MGQARNWTKEEKEYLCEAWGKTSVPSIAKKLNRSVNAIKVMKERLGLGAFLESGDYITFQQCIKALTGSNNGSGYKLKSWIENREFPIHTKKVGKCSFRIVYIKEFWTWAEKNRSFIDFSKMEPLIFGEEPEWVAEQRKKDFESNALQRKDPWTPAEEERLKYLLSLQKYSYTEVSAILGRTEGAIQRRCRDLGIKDRPIKADTHGASAEWTDEMYVLLAEGIKNGDSYALISRKIGKSEKSVRGKVYTKYLTEDADKIRAMIRGGEWGDGAPEPMVKQAIYLSHTRRECREILSRLVGVLKYRMSDMG